MWSLDGTNKASSVALYLGLNPIDGASRIGRTNKNCSVYFSDEKSEKSEKCTKKVHTLRLGRSCCSGDSFVIEFTKLGAFSAG